MMKFARTAVVAAVLPLCASVAGASTVIDTVINFEQGVQSPSAGGSVIFDGYTVSPTNINSGQCEAGDCTLESGQGNLPSITRSDSVLFDFNRFWFSMQGIGGHPGQVNSLYVEGFDKDGISVKKLTFTLGDPLGVFTDYSIAFKLGEGGTGTNDVDCKGSPAVVGEICKSVGYAVTLGSLFDKLSKVTFSSTTTANVRLDGFELQRLSAVPLPAAGWLMLAGLGGLAALRRKRKAA
jgi:hypothetical protein